MIFIAKDVSRIVFEGGFFGSAQNIWGNPYLNSTTVLLISPPIMSCPESKLTVIEQEISVFKGTSDVLY